MTIRTVWLPCSPVMPSDDLVLELWLAPRLPAEAEATGTGPNRVLPGTPAAALAQRDVSDEDPHDRRT